ncbi:MAG: GAF domain-containing protein, partial [Actinomycetota bacterium]
MAARTRQGSRSDVASEFAVARARIAELEAREVEHERALQLLSALYRIAETASVAADMPSFYAGIHQIVGTLMNAENFYIALYDEEHGSINYPYFVDTLDPDAPDPAAWELFGVGHAAGVTAYALKRGEPILIDPPEYERLLKAGEVHATGADTSDSVWVGAPLIADGRTLGIVAVQTYREDRRYRPDDLEVLTFVAQHIATALARARAIEETRQRNAELAVVNEIGAALGRQLEFDAVIEVVGDRLARMFDTGDLSIGIRDARSNLISFPYEIDHGRRVRAEPVPLGDGLTSKVIRERKALRFGSSSEQTAAGGYMGTYEEGDVVSQGESWLGVPIMAGPSAIGVMVIGNDAQNAFSESDERVVGTLASSMGVALENARLSDETKRLLAETDERAAELAVVNSVQQGLAQNLDMQEMYDLVGYKINEIFDAQVVSIMMIDRAAGLVHFPYFLERGKPMSFPPKPLSGGFTGYVVESRLPLLVNKDVVAWLARHNIESVIQGESARAVLFVPLVSGQEVHGLISLQNLDREDVFSESDVRLLTTLASSLSVALENARLFDETRRLLAEADERAAELVVVNSVQQGLAKNLDMQAMYELVGDKIQEIFDAQVVDIGIVDPATDLIHYPYTIERGERMPDTPMAAGVGIGHEVMVSRQPLLINRDIRTYAHDRGWGLQVQGEESKAGLWVPLIVGDTARGVISLQNLDREDAFSESDNISFALFSA